MAEELEAALPDDVCRLAERILAAAKDRGWQLATAESCTGGLLAALFTDVPGYSHVFDRGVVSYSDGAKCDLLGLASDMVENCGAVSRAVAEAMRPRQENGDSVDAPPEAKPEGSNKPGGNA